MPSRAGAVTTVGGRIQPFPQTVLDADAQAVLTLDQVPRTNRLIVTVASVVGATEGGVARVVSVAGRDVTVRVQRARSALLAHVAGAGVLAHAAGAGVLAHAAGAGVLVHAGGAPNLNVLEQPGVIAANVCGAAACDGESLARAGIAKVTAQTTLPNDHAAAAVVAAIADHTAAAVAAALADHSAASVAGALASHAEAVLPAAGALTVDLVVVYEPA